jgi:hypothetical protein
MNIKAKSILLLAITFIAGAVFGITATRIVIKKWVDAATNKPEVLQRGIERDLKRRLGLRPDQQTKLHEITTRSMQEMKTLRAEFQPRLDKVISRSEQQVRAILDEQQKTNFDRVIAERASRRNHRTP